MKTKTSVFASLLNPYFHKEQYSDIIGIELILLVYIFCGFAVICDKYLIPAIEKIKQRYI
jgi:hypothetical protein